MRRSVATATIVVVLLIVTSLLALRYGALSFPALLSLAATIVGSLLPTLLTRGANVVSLKIEVLPHRRGYTVPGGWVKGIQGDPETFQVTEPRDTHLDVSLATPSQLWQTYWWAPTALDAVNGQVPPVQTNLLVVKFGVLRVTATGGAVENCRVHGRARLVVDGGSTSLSDGWQDFGNLNWYSDDIRNRVLSRNGARDAIARAPFLGLNTHLRNSERTIFDGEEADLPVFYMVLGCPTVFLSGGLPRISPGDSIADAPVRFDVKLSFSGKGLARAPPSTFRISAAWDDFRIDKA
jgi:hypothetical protein